MTGRPCRRTPSQAGGYDVKNLRLVLFVWWIAICRSYGRLPHGVWKQCQINRLRGKCTVRRVPSSTSAGAPCTLKKRPRKYNFKVLTATNPRDYLKRKLVQECFDVYVVDLTLTREHANFSGLKIINVNTRQSPGSLIVVYSMHSDLDLVVRAMQLGAHDYITKAECPPNELPARIEGMFEEQTRRLHQREGLEALLADQWDSWQRRYAGKTIAIVNQEVVAVGGDRLDAMLNYDEARLHHPDWSEDPSLVSIPTNGREVK